MIVYIDPTQVAIWNRLLWNKFRNCF